MDKSIIDSIIRSSITRAAEQIAIEELGLDALAVERNHGNVWNFVRDMIKGTGQNAFELNEVRALLEQRTKERDDALTNRSAAVREGAEVIEDRDLLRREVERLREEKDTLQAALKAVHEKADTVCDELGGFLNMLENDPCDLVAFDEAPSADTSVKDILEWIESDAKLSLNGEGERSVSDMESRLDALSELLAEQGELLPSE